MKISDIKKEVEQIKWFHCIDLGNGIVTPGTDNSTDKLKTIKLPEDLSSKSVLDIGAWDGFFSFEAERRGASRVVALDSFSWNGPGWGTKKGFELARRIFNSKVEDKEIEVLDISPETVGTFDVVLFLGVLYHLRHPLLALEKISKVTKELLIVESEMELIEKNRPVMVFYPGDELASDKTNWWAPNQLGMESMLKDVGFKKVKMVSKSGYAYRFARGILNPGKTKLSLSKRMNLVRMTFHAWK